MHTPPPQLSAAMGAPTSANPGPQPEGRRLVAKTLPKRSATTLQPHGYGSPKPQVER
jgi:hypothetical protein